MKRPIFFILIFAGITLFFSGCVVGPKYTGQEVNLPEAFPETRLDTDTIDVSEWWQQLSDPVLDSLINIAIVNNKDLEAAATRVEQARLAAGVASSMLWPDINYQGGISRGDFTGTGQLSAPVNNAFAVGLLNWEIDFWGKYRNARNASLARLLQTEYAQKALGLTIETETAKLYYQLLDYHQRLNIAQYTLSVRTESVNILKQRFERGIIPEIDLDQAIIQEAEAAAAIPLYEELSQKTNNALLSLLGQYDMPVTYLLEHASTETIPQIIPDFLPSDLMRRRPDIMASEQTLVAQYSNAGVMQSIRFPSISLTMAGGYASNDLSNFFSGNPAWSLGAGIFGPVFHFGRNKKNYEIELEKINELQANYEQILLNAFQEVKDVLNEIESLRRQFEIRQLQVKTARHAESLARERYDSGITSYLELLDAQRVLFSIELNYSQTKYDLLRAYVKLYKALGGGW